VFRRPSILLALLGVVVIGAVVGVVGATTGSGARTGSSTPTAQPVYISMGDSYSVGYQNPTLGTTSGFTGYVATRERLQLENFGCGGATTTSLFTQTGCPVGSSASTHGVPYPTTDQVDAVLGYIGDKANFGKVTLVTVSIGGNDVTSCVRDANPVPCVEAATVTIRTNVTDLVKRLDAALSANGDTRAHVVGTTYPDVVLGDYVAPVGFTHPQLAALSTLAFDDFLNPTLRAAYTSVARGAFVDVTNAPYGPATAGDDTGSFNATTGAYAGPTVDLPGFSRTTPVPVAEVCTLTWYCNPRTFGDIHANTKGYAFIGSLVVTKLASL